MLDKFRCSEVVIYNWASFASNHPCLVFEYELHQGEQDLIERGADVAFETRILFMRSTPLGNACLHPNGILNLGFNQEDAIIFALPSGCRLSNALGQTES